MIEIFVCFPTLVVSFFIYLYLMKRFTDQDNVDIFGNLLPLDPNTLYVTISRNQVHSRWLRFLLTVLIIIIIVVIWASLIGLVFFTFIYFKNN